MEDSVQGHSSCFLSRTFFGLYIYRVATRGFWSSLELRVQFSLLVCCTYPSLSTVNKEKNLIDQCASLRVDTRETQQINWRRRHWDFPHRSTSYRRSYPIRSFFASIVSTMAETSELIKLLADQIQVQRQQMEQQAKQTEQQAQFMLSFKVKDTDLTFAHAVQVAIETEDAPRVAKETVYGSKARPVNKVHRNKKKGPQQNHQQSHSKDQKKCYQCGKGHKATDCPYKEAKCHFLWQKGTVESCWPEEATSRTGTFFPQPCEEDHKS